MSWFKEKCRWLNKPSRIAYVFLFPSAVLLLMFNVYPLLASFYISTLDMKVSFDSAKFIGLGNYVEAFQDKYFLNSLGITLKYTLMEVPIQMIMGLVLSALLTKNTLRNQIFRSIYFLPIVCSATVVGVMWNLILHSNIGIVSHWLWKLGVQQTGFLTQPSTALHVVIFVSVWRTFGISTIILVSAMQNVPHDYYEAAEIDGAGKIRQFFSITLPCIKPSFWFLLMTRVIGSLQVFDIVYTLTKGGPSHSTETLVTYVYDKAFVSSTRMGYATAMSEFLFLIIIILTIVQYVIMNKTKD